METLFDVNQYFNSVRPIHFSENEQEQENSETSHIVYFPAKLHKIMGPRFDQEAGESLGLDRVDGLLPIHPDLDIPESILRELMYPAEDMQCELLIVVAMYNEKVAEFENTMRGVADNLKTFHKFGINPKRIGCCLIVDGMKPMNQVMSPDNKGNRTFFKQFYEEDRVKARFNVENTIDCKIPDEKEYDEFAHIFMQNVYLDSEEMFPLQFFFTVKQKNKRKLNTHLWFFGGFCEMVQPEFVVLLDVGTKPLENSLFYMYEAMKIDEQVAGCCGEIKPMDGSMWKLVVPAQEVEYKFSHIFDKALESLIGYITVLPGAFSAYRWKALQGAPMWEDYFKSLCHPEVMGPFNSNIYLAEDRVLCLSLVSKKDSAYTLRYVRAAIAETDVPDSIADLMAQRRRWINGSWFALIDSLKNFQKIFRSEHTVCKKMLFAAQMVYYYLSVAFSWLMVGSFYMILAITVKLEFGSELNEVGTYILVLYVGLLMVVYTLSLGAKPSRTNDLYKGIATIFGIYMILLLFLTFKYFAVANSGVENGDKGWAKLSIMFTFGMLGLNIVINLCVKVVARGLFHFFFMTPTYINVFLIYSICNIHDCSWGNRPDTMTEEELKRVEEFEEFRARWSIVWILCNSGFAFFLVALDSASEENGWYVYAIALVSVGIIALRTMGGLLYFVQEMYCKKKMKKLTYTQRRENEDKEKYQTGSMLMKQSDVVSPMTEMSYFNMSPRKVDQIPEDHSESEKYLQTQSLENDSQGEARENSSLSVPNTDSLLNSVSRESSGSVSEESSEILEHSTDEPPELKILISQTRENLNLSVSYVAEAAGIPKSLLQEIEDGDYIPSNYELENLTKVLKLN